MNWQPVETAPIDTPVLIIDGNGTIAVGEMNHRRNWFIADSFGFNEDGSIYNVSHWMPLPDKPTDWKRYEY